jgi:hypothetical protein
VSQQLLLLAVVVVGVKETKMVELEALVGALVVEIVLLVLGALELLVKVLLVAQAIQEALLGALVAVAVQGL